VDLLIDTVHRIGAKAEQRVERELIEDLKRVAGKNNPRSPFFAATDTGAS